LNPIIIFWESPLNEKLMGNSFGIEMEKLYSI